ncbi:tafazzin-like [Liolophura sinensis]|uniref:tafazzin-like n=1 Tax=Liolophura sinensis TaxID=3198878 RepID=UPI00315961C3
MCYDQRWLKIQNPRNSTRLWMIGSKIAVYTVGLLSKLWLGGFNSLNLVNKELLYKALENRLPEQGLITVANHYSCFDEPLLWGTLKCKHLVNHKLMRWSPAAHNICYTNYIHALFFSLGKSVALRRCDGVYQRGMGFLSDRLKQGHWVHFFPEGRVNLNKEHLRLKWGVGRLISECNITPVIIPMFHLGIDDILPNREPYIPRIRKRVTVLVGEPIEISEEISHLKQAHKTPREIRKFITDCIQEELRVLRVQAEQIHAAWNS